MSDAESQYPRCAEIRATLPGTCTIACDVRDDDPDWIYAHVPACQREYIGHLETALAAERAARQAAEQDRDSSVSDRINEPDDLRGMLPTEIVAAFQRERAARQAAEQHVAALRDAIRPFAALATPFEFQQVGVSRDDVERLRALLAPPAGEQEPAVREGLTAAQALMQADYDLVTEIDTVHERRAAEGGAGGTCPCGHLIAEHHPKVGCFGESECACPMQYREAADQQQPGEAAP